MVQEISFQVFHRAKIVLCPFAQYLQRESEAAGREPRERLLPATLGHRPRDGAAADRDGTAAGVEHDAGGVQAERAGGAGLRDVVRAAVLQLNLAATHGAVGVGVHREIQGAGSAAEIRAGDVQPSGEALRIGRAPRRGRGEAERAGVAVRTHLAA